MNLVREQFAIQIKLQIQSTPDTFIDIPRTFRTKIGYDVIIKVRLKSGNLASAQIARPTGPSGLDAALRLFILPEFSLNAPLCKLCAKTFVLAEHSHWKLL